MEISLKIILSKYSKDWRKNGSSENSQELLQKKTINSRKSNMMTIEIMGSMKLVWTKDETGAKISFL